MIAIGALALSLAAGLAAQAEPGAPAPSTRPATQPTGGRIVNERCGFQLVCPDGLEVATPTAERQKTRLAAGSEGPDDVFAEGINVELLFEGQAARVGLEPLYEQYRQSMTRAGMTVVEATDVEVAGIPAKRIVYSHPLSLLGKELQVKSVEWFFVRGEQIWKIDARSEARRYDWLAPRAEEVVRSFEFTEQ